MIPKRSFARDVLTVPALGLGAGNLGDPALSDDDVDRLLSGAIELGVTLIDTAPSYGTSEERIGRLLRGRRDRVVLSTKVGYGVPGVKDWTADAVRLGVDRALIRLRTDWIDIVHLHSCPADVLEAGDVPAALVRAVQDGKIRVAAYAGDAHALYVATRLPGLGSVQASLSVCDRSNLPTLRLAAEGGLGTIGKRVLANAPWRHASQPQRADEAVYWSRWHSLALQLDGAEPADVALRWVVHHGGVGCALVGTRSVSRLESAARAVLAGPLPEALLAHLDARYEQVGRSWAPVT
ncbi:MAG: aldo/keto reductase [Myxococcota bacterium]